MAIKGAGGRAKGAGRHPGKDAPNGGEVIASSFPGTTKQRLRRPQIRNLRDESAFELMQAPKTMKIT